MSNAERPLNAPPRRLPRSHRWRISFQVRAIGLAAAILLALAIWAGSRGLNFFDSALIGYAWATVALTFAVVSVYARWLRMPSTRRYWRRGWELATSWKTFKRLPTLLPRASAGQLLGQQFIRRRGWVRWIGHQCLFWGVIGATLITFPLVWGWLTFRIEPGRSNWYVIQVFGFRTISFPTYNFLGWSLFHALDYTAALVIIGCLIFLWRRFRDRGVMAVQRFSFDMVPLLMLVVIAVTGLLLTFSASVLHGAYYEVFQIVHMASVVLALVFIPFGKFFHVLQRPSSIGIQMYTETNTLDGRRACASCGEPLAPAVFVNDLQATLGELGQHYSLTPALAAPAATTAPAPAAATAQPNEPAGVPDASDRPGPSGPAMPESTNVSAHPIAADDLTELCPRCKRHARARAFFSANGRSFAR